MRRDDTTIHHYFYPDFIGYLFGPRRPEDVFIERHLLYCEGCLKRFAEVMRT